MHCHNSLHHLLLRNAGGTMNTRTFPTPNHLALALVSQRLNVLRYSLRSLTYLNQTDIAVTREALSICEQQGAKTKATLLRRKLKKMEKQYNAAIKLFQDQKLKAVKA
jgi:hypothetical protein